MLSVVVSSGISSKSEDAASLQTALIGQIAATEIQIEGALTELRRTGGAQLAESEQQLRSLGQLRQALATADPSTLPVIRAQVVASLANAGATLQQARVAAGQPSAEIATLSAARAESRQLAEATQRALFEDRILDASLRFASPADEEAYRQREAERLALIDSLDPRNPRSARDQLLIQRDQVDDAMAHGADRDPRAQQMRDQIDRQLRLQREAEIKAGRDPEEYDREVEALQASLPRHGRSARAEERAAYIARGWKSEPAIGGTESAAMPSTTASSARSQKDALATAAQDLEAAPDGFDDPVYQVAQQLKAAGVSAPAAPDDVTPGTAMRSAQTVGQTPEGRA